MPQRRFSLSSFLLLLVLVGALSACQPASSKASTTAAIAPTSTRFATVKLVQRSAQSGQIPAGKSRTIVATCQPGEQLLSGGYSVYAFEAAANVIASYPSGPDAWTVTDDNTHGPSSIQITATANCLQAPYSIGMRVVSSAGTSQATAADCPAGAVITGGGFQATESVAASMPTPRGWRSEPGKVFVLCTTQQVRAAPAQSAHFTTRMIFGSPQGDAAHCGDGQIVTGGGYSFEQGQTAIAVNTLAPDASGWGIGAAGGYTPVSVTVWAVCVIAPRRPEHQTSAPNLEMRGTCPAPR